MNKNFFSLGVEDGLGIFVVNVWNDCIIKCQNFLINVVDLFNILVFCKNSIFDYLYV